MIRVRTTAEALQALTIQVKALKSSCAAFDSGDRWEAIRLATAAHTVVHDASKKNQSLLTLAGKKVGMKFLATGPEIDGRNLLADTPLVVMQMDIRRGQFLPRLGEMSEDHRWLSFGEWWERDHIYSSGSGKHLLSRKNLTFALRNKDGGAHYDLQIHDQNYVQMAEGPAWTYHNSDGAEQTLMEVELVTMRQVAWELLESLKHHGLLEDGSA